MDYSNDITILCRVVDNYGDIGFAYRLARSLSRMQPHSFIRIITDDLHAFSLLASDIDERAPVQQYNNWLIYDWNNADVCAAAFSARQPCTILQCFQCGYPTWLETLLFEKRFPDVVHVVNIDYLTAESYAEEFHKLASLTRSARVQKVNFMPGFTANTGGLLLDSVMNERTASAVTHVPESVLVPHMSESEPHNTSVPRIVADVCSTHISVNTTAAAPTSAREFSVLVFTYERDFMPLVCAFSQFEKLQEAFCTQRNCTLPSSCTQRDCAPPTTPYDCTHSITPNAQQPCRHAIRTYVAAGSIQQSFAHAWHADGKRFALTPLPFLPQREWDAFLFSMDMLFVRGEDSLSRACLSGIPFVWHAYRQESDYQKVKVRALLKTMQPFFAKADFTLLESVWLAFNTSSTADASARGKTDANCITVSNDELASLLLQFLENAETMRTSFKSFAASLVTNGDFAQHLLNFLATLQPPATPHT
ncbi:MAG: elongation factor P maturation arginine rhamnosyltransferase EarP [Treponema sp.]|nr:elongation factor P maturation arginine rhamnosyltransferase EarP [Treponema sp.]